jgi:hypothetical protein
VEIAVSGHTNGHREQLRLEPYYLRANGAMIAASIRLSPTFELRIFKKAVRRRKPASNV